MRETNNGSQVAQLRTSADLQAKLNSQKAEIGRLRNQLSQSEEVGVGSLVEIEDELAALKNENDELKSALQSNVATDKVTIEALQNELALAKRELRDLGVGSLVQMEDELAALKNENDDLKSLLQSNSGADQEAVESLQRELALAQSKLNQLENLELQNQEPSPKVAPPKELTSDPSMIQKAMDLEMKLEMALSKLNRWKVKKWLQMMPIMICWKNNLPKPILP